MAGVPRVAGFPDYSSTGTVGFIPSIWSGQLNVKFYSTTCFGEIANTRWEGEISGQGDSVQIRTRASITVRDYEQGGGLKYERPESPKIILNIDKAKYIATEVPDILKHQSDINLMEEWSLDGGKQMAIKIDKDVLGNIYSDAATENSGATAGKLSGGYDMGASGSPVQISKTNIIDFLVDVDSVLGEQDIDDDGRWIVLPTWCRGMLLKSDLLQDASKTGDKSSVIRNGKLGRLLNFDVFISNNLTMATDGSDLVTNIVAGHKEAVTFASQITEMDEMPNPNDFGRLIRTKKVYGYKVVNPHAMVHGYITRATAGS